MTDFLQQIDPIHSRTETSTQRGDTYTLFMHFITKVNPVLNENGIKSTLNHDKHINCAEEGDNCVGR